MHGLKMMPANPKQGFTNLDKILVQVDIVKELHR
jgi:hypothetical protein